MGIYTGSSTSPIEVEALGTTANHYGGSQIFIWNIADTSRIVASNLKVNGVDPSAAGFHGPAGRWGGVLDDSYMTGALDYYGKTGAYAHVVTSNMTTAYNHGPFRLMLGVRSDLMSYAESTWAGTGNFRDRGDNYGEAKTLGGSPIAQLNAQGYPGAGATASSIAGSDFRGHTLIELEKRDDDGNSTHQPIFGSRPHTHSSKRTGVAYPNQWSFANQLMEDYSPSGAVDPADANVNLWPQFAIPPIHMDWQGYLRNFFDESAAETFANAKHGANKMVNMCSIFRSNTNPLLGGEGRDGIATAHFTFGPGVRSVNMFDLNKLI